MIFRQILNRTALSRPLVLLVASGWLVTSAACGTNDAKAEANGLEPGTFDPYTASTVAELLETKHYLQRQLDDEVSEQWLRAYLDTLDPDHSVFLAGDVESFMRFQHRLDDDVKASKARLTVPFEIFEVFQQRMQARLDTARAQLDQPVDFTTQEVIQVDRSEAPWPATHEEADELWRLRIKDQLLAAELADRERKAKSSGEVEGESLRAKRIQQLKRRYDTQERTFVVDVEPIDVLEWWLTSLTGVYDPHSTYFAPATSDNFDIDLSKSLEGIGAVLTQDDDWYTEIRELVPGGPAAQDEELQVGDKIVAVAQAGEDPVDVVGLRLDNVVKLIRGPKGTEVFLTVIPAEANGDTTVTRVIDITRDKVELQDTLAKYEIHRVELDGHTYRIGRIDLADFYTPRGEEDGPRAAEDVRKLLVALDKQKVDAVALDLRFNGGGSLPEAIEMAGLFMPRGPMVQVHDAVRDQTDAMHDPAPDVAWDGPLVVLTSQLSASASEIVAGAVQDYGRGLIIGAQQTHGKGTVQTLIGLAPWVQVSARRRMIEDMSGALKLTTQKFYRVSGGSTQSKGVESDVVLPSPWDGRKVLESDLDNPMAYDTISSARYQPVGDVSQYRAELQRRADARITGNEDFDRYKAQVKLLAENPQFFSLNIDERAAENKRRQSILGLDDSVADTADDKADDPKDTPKREQFLANGELAPKRPDVGSEDAVLLEALNVTADFVSLLRREG